MPSTSTIDASPPRTGEIRVRGFSTGAVRGKRRRHGPRRYLPGGWSERTLPVNVFVVEHPAGVCLFDAGQTALATAPGYFPWWYPFFRLARFELGPQDEAAAQLSQAGIDPAAVRWLVLSHLHTEHAGGVGGFPHADVLVSRDEWQRATDRRARLRLRGYLPQHWPETVRPRLVDFSGGPVGPFPASHDIAGDGRLVLVPTPGHTPGHMAMVVRGQDGGFLCAGDLVETAEELEEAAPEVAAFCAREGLRVLAAHDPRAMERERG
jgi:N-acyl homoserine lactone hydrolase